MHKGKQNKTTWLFSICQAFMYKILQNCFISPSDLLQKRLSAQLFGTQIIHLALKESPCIHHRF